MPSRLPKHVRKDRALVLRDKALKLVQSKGKLSPLLTGKTVLFKTLTYQSGYLKIHYRSPFGTIPDDTAMMPYGLDLYWPKKVLVIEWNDAGGVRIVGFRRGGGKPSLLRSPHREGQLHHDRPPRTRTGLAEPRKRKPRDWPLERTIRAALENLGNREVVMRARGTQEVKA